MIKNSILFPIEVAADVLLKKAERWICSTLGCEYRHILVLLCLKDKKLHQQELANCLFINKGVMVKILDTMEGKKWLKRTVSPADRRERIITITAAGEKLLQKYFMHRDASIREVFAPLTEEEITHLCTLAAAVLYPQRN